PKAVAISALNKNILPYFQLKTYTICDKSFSILYASVNINPDPITNIYPVSNLGSKSGFNLLIKIKLNACINIEIKINKSPVEIDATPSSPTIEVTIIPINPKKKPNNRNLVILSFSRITDKIIVTRGAAPKIIPALTPVVLAKPNAKKE